MVIFSCSQIEGPTESVDTKVRISVLVTSSINFDHSATMKCMARSGLCAADARPELFPVPGTIEALGLRGQI